MLADQQNPEAQKQNQSILTSTLSIAQHTLSLSLLPNSLQFTFYTEHLLTCSIDTATLSSHPTLSFCFASLLQFYEHLLSHPCIHLIQARMELTIEVTVSEKKKVNHVLIELTKVDETGEQRLSRVVQTLTKEVRTLKESQLKDRLIIGGLKDDIDELKRSFASWRELGQTKTFGQTKTLTGDKSRFFSKATTQLSAPSILRKETLNIPYQYQINTDHPSAKCFTYQSGKITKISQPATNTPLFGNASLSVLGTHYQVTQLKAEQNNVIYGVGTAKLLTLSPAKVCSSRQFIGYFAHNGYIWHEGQYKKGNRKVIQDGDKVEVVAGRAIVTWRVNGEQINSCSATIGIQGEPLIPVVIMYGVGDQLQIHQNT